MDALTAEAEHQRDGRAAQVDVEDANLLPRLLPDEWRASGGGRPSGRTATRERARETVIELLPTPPLPESTSTTRFTPASRSDTDIGILYPSVRPREEVPVPRRGAMRRTPRTALCPVGAGAAARLRTTGAPRLRFK